MEKKTKIQIIEETVEYYSTHPRSVEKAGQCVYLTTDGKMCAFSRCCTKEGVKRLHSTCEGEGVPDVHETLLKKEYLGHNRLFWLNIQKIHDQGYFWTMGKFNELGESFVLSIKKLYEKD